MTEAVLAVQIVDPRMRRPQFIAEEVIKPVVAFIKHGLHRGLGVNQLQRFQRAMPSL